MGLCGALYDDETDAIVPDGAPFESADMSSGEVYLFWAPIPEGLPKMVVKLTDGSDDYLWIPRLSDVDDSLITNEFFVPRPAKD